MNLAEMAEFLAPHGLATRGALGLGADELSLPEVGRVRTLVLVGFVGSSGWSVFENAPERRDGAANPLDRWSRRIIGALAAECGGAPLYPFDGPVFHPFQSWARRADNVFVSPLGLLIHPQFGLWHSYRGAVALADDIELPAVPARISPCEACVAKPCLNACPVGAFAPGSYDVKACVAHLNTSDGARCMNVGCLARNACPVGADFAPVQAQARFHMEAFRRARSA